MQRCPGQNDDGQMFVIVKQRYFNSSFIFFSFYIYFFFLFFFLFLFFFSPECIFVKRDEYFF